MWFLAFFQGSSSTSPQRDLSVATTTKSERVEHMQALGKNLPDCSPSHPRGHGGCMDYGFASRVGTGMPTQTHSKEQSHEAHRFRKRPGGRQMPSRLRVMDRRARETPPLTSRMLQRSGLVITHSSSGRGRAHFRRRALRNEPKHPGYRTHLGPSVQGPRRPA